MWRPVLLSSMLCLPLSAATGKTVTLRWEAIGGATAYELEVRRNAKAVVGRQVPGDRTSWSTALPPGVYVFRLRAIDWAKQAGEWSVPAPLFVSPPKPVIRLPPEKRQWTQGQLNEGVPIQWQAVRGVSAYRVQVLRDGQTHSDVKQQSNRFLLKPVPPGDYQVYVFPLIHLPSPLPDGLEKAQWEGERSDPRTFRVEGRPTERADPPLALRIGLAPTWEFFQIRAQEQATGAAVAVNSNLIPGLLATVEKGITRTLQATALLHVVSTTLQPVATRAVEDRERTLLNWALGLDYSLWFAPKVRLGLRFGNEGQALLRMSPEGVISPDSVSLWNAAVTLQAPLGSLAGIQLGVEGRFSGYFSRQAEPDFFRNGVSAQARLFGERTVWGGVGIRGFFHYERSILNAVQIETSRQQMGAGLGVFYRFE